MGFYTHNGCEFVNIKMNKLNARLGITIRYGPFYSLWSNGINDKNYANCDMTINKLMGGKGSPDQFTCSGSIMDT